MDKRSTTTIRPPQPPTPSHAAAPATLPSGPAVRWVLGLVLVEAASLLTFYLRAH